MKVLALRKLEIIAGDSGSTKQDLAEANRHHAFLLMRLCKKIAEQFGIQAINGLAFDFDAIQPGEEELSVEVWSDQVRLAKATLKELDIFDPEMVDPIELEKALTRFTMNCGLNVSFGFIYVPPEE
jgi:hypothetical protein